MSQVVRTVETGGISEQSDFTIKASAHAFKILSSGLYPDKIKAVIRELCCNAYDSHVAANQKTVPFKVHLPNVMEPWFSVQDFGTGMTHDQVMNLYSTYFESNKGHSNELIGGLGLGSKSPFSYVDTFTVISVSNGKKCTYSAYVSTEGKPSIALMLEEATEQSNGVTVQLSVKPIDFNTFVEKAEELLWRFEPQPVVTGNGQFSFKQRKILLDGADWRVYLLMGEYGRRRACAIMGNVCYPLERSALTDLSSAQQAILECSIDIDFAIGDLDITASREALSYDKRTIENIKNRLDVVIAEMQNNIQKEFDRCTTIWQAKTLYRTLFHLNDNGYLSNIVAKLNPDNGYRPVFVWRNQKIDSASITIDTKTQYPGISLQYWCSKKRRGERRSRSVDQVDGIYTIENFEKMRFMRNDLTSYSTRVGDFMKNQQNININDRIFHLYLVLGEQAAVDNFFQTLGYTEEVLKTSDTPKRPSQKKESRDHFEVTVFNKNQENFSLKQTTDFSEKAYYIEARYLKEIFAGDYDFGRLWGEIKASGLIDDTLPIYALYANQKKRVEKLPTMIDLKKMLCNLIAYKVSNPNFVERNANYITAGFIEAYIRALSDVLRSTEVQTLQHNSPFKKLADFICQSDLSAQEKTLSQFAKYFQIPVQYHEDNLEFEKTAKKMVEQLWDQYGMLRPLDRYYSSYSFRDKLKIAEVIKYVKMVDANS